MGKYGDDLTHGETPTSSYSISRRCWKCYVRSEALRSFLICISVNCSCASVDWLYSFRSLRCVRLGQSETVLDIGLSHIWIRRQSHLDTDTSYLEYLDSSHHNGRRFAPLACTRSKPHQPKGPVHPLPQPRLHNLWPHILLLVVRFHDRLLVMVWYAQIPIPSSCIFLISPQPFPRVSHTVPQHPSAMHPRRKISPPTNLPQPFHPSSRTLSRAICT
jgi:hypothetical protein